jgi:hypothetical protein
MSRHTRIAATAAIALSLLLAPRMALAEDKPKSTKEIIEIIAADPLEGPAHDAYWSMQAAKERCDPGSYAAHRTRLMGVIAAMRYYAKKAKKIKGFANQDPADLNGRAEDFESLIKMLDERPWPCPDKPKTDDHSSLPFPGGNKADPPDWAIAVASQQANVIHDSFDRPGTGSFDGLAMVDRAMRAAHSGGMDAGRQPCDGEQEGWSNVHRTDPRYPGGFGPQTNPFARVPSFGGWGF